MAPDTNVLVTGGAGFIGSHLVDVLLERPYDRGHGARPALVRRAAERTSRRTTVTPACGSSSETCPTQASSTAWSTAPIA